MVQCESEGPLPIVDIHPSLFGQALHNIIDNAIKYSETGSKVMVQTSADDTHAMVSICDEGRGISGEDLDRVFEPFYRAADSQNAPIGGVGLGLAVSRRIIESFGGRMSVAARPRIGSTFAIQLPIANAQESKRDRGMARS